MHIMEVKTMKEFRPSDDFVSRVMKEVRDCEDRRTAYPGVGDRILASRAFRFAMSGGGIFFGIMLAPVACL